MLLPCTSSKAWIASNKETYNVMFNELGDKLFVYIGIRVLINDVHTKLYDQQPVWMLTPTGEYKEYLAHGTRIFYSERFGTFTVTYGPRPKFEKLYDRVYIDRGRPVVTMGEVFRGMSYTQFIEEYQGFGKNVIAAMRIAHPKREIC